MSGYQTLPPGDPADGDGDQDPNEPTSRQIGAAQDMSNTELAQALETLADDPTRSPTRKAQLRVAARRLRFPGVYNRHA